MGALIPNIDNNCANFRIFYVERIIHTYYGILLLKWIVNFFFQEHLAIEKIKNHFFSSSLHFHCPWTLFCTNINTYMQRKLKIGFGTPYFCFIMKNFHLSAIVEDFVSGQYTSHAIQFFCLHTKTNFHTIAKKRNEKS